MTVFFAERRFLFIAWALCFMATKCAFAKDRLDTLTVDYATYNPISLLLKEKGFLEEQLRGKHLNVKWVKSDGSNQAIDNLYAGAIDVGSTAAAASLLARMRGVKIKVVGVFSKPEWAAMVTLEKSKIRSPRDLVGKRVAVTRGTDPHIFLIRSLASEGIALESVRLHFVQHQAGLKALKMGLVDAWVGLDPFIAIAEVEDKAQLFYRNPGFNSFGAINVSDEFLEKNPSIVSDVLAAYEKARLYALEHPTEYMKILSDYVVLDQAVLRRFLGRTNIEDRVVHDADIRGLVAAGTALQTQHIAPSSIDVQSTVEALLVSVGKREVKVSP